MREEANMNDERIAKLEAAVQEITVRLGMSGVLPRSPAPPVDHLERVAKVPREVVEAMARVVPGRVRDL
jgi:hypothetical protein